MVRGALHEGGRLLAALARWMEVPLQALAADPLPSWNEGTVKHAIIDFVTRATTEGDAGFVPVEARIATFDNDGTLWPEQPLVQGAFLLKPLRSRVKEDPTLSKRQPFKAILEGDLSELSLMDKARLTKLLGETHAGMTEEAFIRDVRTFFQNARHPRWDVPYNQLAYAPMLELLRYLRANGFQTWLASAGGIDFMRVISEATYGIPPQQVIGSQLKKSLDEAHAPSVLRREARVSHVNDKAGKPVGIDEHIGRRPVFAAGNVRSGGDIQMLQYTRKRGCPGFALLIHHDDAVREFAYEENDGASLKAARQGGWTVVSMQRDWRRIFDGTRVPDENGGG
ncbi:acid phosphatase [Myxococcus hansupus]|uniref:Acid phosphatase n=1 Tax=Pseudomyxococcus hansupus TaxID=1297742 RepID=A0A0H4WJE6_9BACT|nr:HAD family hydrolase [Myxococcus hansupus]AKQ63461.1 acid phosphatase [Myxococcus hansupus]